MGSFLKLFTFVLLLQGFAHAGVKSNLKKKFNSMIDVLVLTHKNIKDFDAILGVDSPLDNSVENKELIKKAQKNKDQILSSETYTNLQILRSEIESFQEEMKEVYYEAVIDFAHNPKRLKTKQKLKILKKIISKEITLSNKKIDHDLILLIVKMVHEKAGELDQMLLSYSKKSKSSEVVARIHQERILIRAMKLYKWHKELKEELIIKKNFKIISEQKSYKSLEDKIKSKSKSLLKSRQPQNSLILPSSGKSGNISGLKYPFDTWSITFDDGPNRTTSKDVLSDLQEYGYKATWYMLGQMVESNLSVASAIRDAGMEIAVHSHSHKNLPKQSFATQKREIVQATNEVESLLGVKVHSFRLPYGSGVNNSQIRKLIADRDLVHAFWAVDTLDWKDKDPQKIFNRTVAQMNNTKRGIILFHDIHRQSQKASRLLYAHLQQKKSRVCTVKAAVDEVNGEITNCEDADGNTPRDMTKSVEGQISLICESIQKRISVVQSLSSLFDNESGALNSCMTSRQWDKYSTPGRDMRIIRSITNLKNLHKRIQSSEFLELDEELNNFLIDLNESGVETPPQLKALCSFKIDTAGRIVSLGHVVQSLDSDTLSFNPHDDLSSRWGLSGVKSSCTTGSRAGYYGYPK